MSQNDPEALPMSAEVKRLTREVAILTRVVERQRAELVSLSGKQFPAGHARLKNHALGTIHEILTVVAEDIVSRIKAMDPAKNPNTEDVMMEIVTKTNLFDKTWYLESNGDVSNSGIDGLVHYIKHGLAERREPNSFFF